jgi:uncharacterized membrane protein
LATVLICPGWQSSQRPSLLYSPSTPSTATTKRPAAQAGVGLAVGAAVGYAVGYAVGALVGAAVGYAVGYAVGALVGAAVG